MNFSKITAVVAGLALLGTTTALRAQEPRNKAAVDTLVKKVALAVLKKQSGNDATKLTKSLLACGANCDPISLIKVTSWSKIGERLNSISSLKNRADFTGLPSSEANQRLNVAFNAFYEAQKNDKNYSNALTPSVRKEILQEIGITNTDPSTDSALPAVTDTGDVITNASDSTTPLLEDNIRTETQKSDPILSVVFTIGWVLLGIALGGLGGFWLATRRANLEIDSLKADKEKLAKDYDTLVKERNAELKPRFQNQPRTPEKTVPKTEPPVATTEPGAIQSGEVTVGSPIAVSANVVAGLPEVPASETVSSQSRNELYYFPAPDENGFFDNAQRTTSPTPETGYRLLVNPNQPTHATFRFEAEPGRVARFLAYRNYLIDTACESINSFQEGNTRILTEKEGQAVLDNGRWRVETKAKIAFA